MLASSLPRLISLDDDLLDDDRLCLDLFFGLLLDLVREELVEEYFLIFPSLLLLDLDFNFFPSSDLDRLLLSLFRLDLLSAFDLDLDLAIV